jgi:hypothetical protein
MRDKNEDVFYSAGWRDGYWAGKEVGMSETAAAGELAAMRDLLQRAQRQAAPVSGIADQKDRNDE